MNKGKKRQVFFILLLILVLAVFFRFYKLNEIPPGLYPDVAMNGTDALEAIKTGHYKLFYPENNGREGLFINLIALSFLVFGPSILAIKIVPAIFGTLTVIGIYLLTKQLFKYWEGEEIFGISTAEIIALFSTFFISISFWHVNFSRLGFRAIMVPFFLVWSFYFLFKAINSPERGIISWVLAGVFFGLGFHTYIAFRVAPLILFPIAFIEIAKYWPRFKSLIKERLSWLPLIKQIYIKDNWWKWDIFFLAIILAALPMIFYYFYHPADFMGRAGQVSIFASESPIKTLAESTIKTLGQFIVWGDTNWRHNLSASPQIFWPAIPCFLIGIIFSLIQIFKIGNYRQKKWAPLNANYALLVWWGSMLLPSIMTNEGLPHALRSIGAIPPSYIFVGIGSYFVIKFVKIRVPNRKISMAVFGVLIAGLIFTVGAEYYRYFIFWGQNQETKGAFTQKFVDEANYLNSLPANVKKYVIVNEPGVAVPYPDGLPMPSQTIQFITDGKSSVEYIKIDELNKIKRTANPTIILPMTSDEKIFSQLKSKFPNGYIDKENNFSVFKINFSKIAYY